MHRLWWWRRRPDALDCQVAIIGGGAGGLHTAYRLAPEMGEGVCLFEKEGRLGGRIYDVPKDDSDPDSPVFGTGARRVMEGQEILFALAEDLDIENQDVHDWAVEPLPGEAYNPNRSGWSDGAYKSSIHLLNTRYDMDLPTARTQPPAVRTRWSLTR